MNFAILGSGMIADFHRLAIAANADQGARLTCVAHYDPERFKTIGARFEAPCVSEEEMLQREDVDAVCICTPSGQHPDQAVAAAEAGKHVLMEKPMALSLRDADRMIEACDRAGVKLGLVFQRRTMASFQKVYDAIQAGDLGELTLGAVSMPYFRGQAYYDQAEWRGTWEMDGGGVLMNQGIHIIDLLVWYMGDPIEIESFAGTLRRSIDVEDTVAATLHFKNGAMATVAASTTAAPGFPHRIEIYGDEGGIQIEGETIRQWLLVNPEKARVTPEIGADDLSAGSGGDPRAISTTGHTNIVKDFIEAVRDNRPPLIDGVEGRRSLATILEIYQAAGLPVTG